MSMKDGMLVQGIRGQQTVAQTFPRPYFMAKGGKFEINYVDDGTDQVSEIEFSISCLYEPTD